MFSGKACLAEQICINIAYYNMRYWQLSESSFVEIKTDMAGKVPYLIVDLWNIGCCLYTEYHVMSHL